MEELFKYTSPKEAVNLPFLRTEGTSKPLRPLLHHARKLNGLTLEVLTTMKSSHLF